MTDDVLAFYKPAFLGMQVNVNAKELDFSNWNSISEHDLTVFFHEYIHFLQDISTVWGVNNIYVYGEYITGSVERILNLPTGEFRIPFHIVDENENIKLNQDTINVTLGDTGSIQCFEIKEIVENEYELLCNEETISIPEIQLAIDGENGEDIIVFGARAIQENMAYLMEKLCSPNSFEPSPEFPYSAAEKVCDFIIPGFSEKQLIVLALCDMSLQYTNPGKCFVSTMYEIKDGVINIECAEDVYDYFYSKEETPLDVFKEIGGLKDSAIGHLMGYMDPCNPKLSEFYLWISKIFNFSQQWRRSNKYLLLELAQAGMLSKNKIFKCILNDVGTPLIKTADSRYLKYQKEYGVEYMNVVSQLNDLFGKASIACDIIDYCNPVDCKDICVQRPWENKPRDCPFKEIWDHFKLNEYVPKQ